MKKFTATTALLLAILTNCLPVKAQEKTELMAKPRLYIECANSGLCNLDYIRNEIKVTDFVRDRFQANIHIMVLSQPTGGNGEQHTVTFIGQEGFTGTIDTLTFYTVANATEDEKRQQFIRYIKIGLVPFLVQSSHINLIDIQYKEPATATATAPIKDKWKGWSFTIGGRLFLSGDKNYTEHSLGINASAAKVTDKFKTSFSYYQNQSKNRYRYMDAGEKFELRTLNAYREFRHEYVKSINPKWSIAYSTEYIHSTYDNINHGFTITPGIEYNIYPYKQSSSKFLAVRYSIDGERRNYLEETVYGKKKEWLFSQDLSAYASYTQKWGSINGSVNWYNYLHDVSKNNLSVYFEIELRLVKGLSLNWYTSASIINDQLNLGKEGADPQEVLLQLKALSTSYNYHTSIGINFRFGSAFNNIVNPRFTSGRM